MTIFALDEVVWDSVFFPAVVKPVDCNSSKGVRKVENREDAEAAISKAIQLSRSHQAIVEGFNEGPEIQVDCLATSSGVKIMMTRQKQKIRSDRSAMALQSYGSVFPAPLDSSQMFDVQSIAERIASAFGLHNTPFFYQAVITGKGISVLEFAPRVGGGLSYSILKEYGAYDAVEYVIDSYLGIELKAEPCIPTDKYLSSNIVYVRPGVFDHMEGFETLLDKGLIDRTYLMKSRGDCIDGDLRSSNRVAAFVVTEKDYQSLLFKSCQAFLSIEAFDIDGNPMINRSIYPFAQ